MPLALLSALLWDLRSQCESQVQALTDAQRQLDAFRDASDAPDQQAALEALTLDLQRVLDANVTVRSTAQEANQELATLTTNPRKRQ